MFTCDIINGKANIYLIFSTSNNKAELILDASHESGTVKIDEHHYYFTFPHKRNESHLIVNRYSGKLTLEFGAPPFGENSSNNIHSTGKCKKSKIKKAL